MVEIKGKWPPSQNTFCPKVERFFLLSDENYIFRGKTAVFGGR